MKRVVVFSDSHGREDRLSEALGTALAREEADAAVFLGDGLADWERVASACRSSHPRTTFYAVRGNCDWDAQAPASLTFTLGGVRLYACHGHEWRVKYSLERLCYAAREQEARVALFGHTHRSCLVFEAGCTLLNPGSAADAGRGSPLYGEVRIWDDGSVHADLIARA